MARWIKIYDSLLEWGWHTRPEMVSLFVHLLITANVKDGFFQGVAIRRGELATSVASLTSLTGLTTQSVRTCLKHLQETGEITIKSTNRFSIITICKYDSYQAKKDPSQQTTNKQLTNDQQTTNKRLTTNIEYKNIDNKKEDIYNNLSSSYSSSSFLGLTPKQQQEEQFLFYEIFFFKNYGHLNTEVERFIAANNSTLWTNHSGKEYRTRAQRLALARLWMQKPTQEPRVKVQGFLPIWKKCYERCKAETPELAHAFLDARTDCQTTEKFGHTDELQIYCKKEVFDWFRQDDTRKNLIMEPIKTVLSNYGKKEVHFYPYK